MIHRTKLANRSLPCYSRGEEIINMVTHITGGGCGLILSAITCILAAKHRDPITLVGCIVFSITITTLYTMSSIYHGLKPGTAKKVMQVLDHCTIYLLISGTYTPILLGSFIQRFPSICWGLLIFQWTLAALAIIFTAIDLNKYRVFSMVCYIGMGWSILIYIPQTIQVLTMNGFLLLLSGGIAYTIGAILYGIGSKKPWFHSIFHIFVVLGSIMQTLSILLYVV